MAHCLDRCRACFRCCFKFIRTIPASAAFIVAVAFSGLYHDSACAAMQGLHGIDKFYCDGRLISAGETRDEVIDKCGEPAWREVRTDEATEAGTDSSSPGETEEWIYDFGHNQLLEFLRFRNGRLVTIRTGNYGFGGSRAGDCDYGANLALGDSKLEVVAKCGEPTGGGTVSEAPLQPEGSVDRRRELLSKDQWVYDFGPDHFVHYLIFRHGRLMEIRSGGFGR